MSAQVKNAGQSSELLGLRSVLIGSLPATLMTDDAPGRYTVEAVFTRRTDREQDRAAAVAALAESVAFARRVTMPDAEDDARIEDWVEEGGAVRA